MKKLSIIFFVILAFTLSSCENKSQNKETSQTDTTQQKKELTNLERDFIMEAANGNLLEIQLGELAHKKASSQKVKDFGHHLMMNHEEANNKLKELAKEKNITLPDSIEGGKDLKKDLNKLSGKEFDKKFMNEMVKDHKQDVEKFEEMAEKANDPDVKTYAQQTLPTLKSHYLEAQKLDSMLTTSGNKKKSGNKMSMK